MEESHRRGDASRRLGFTLIEIMAVVLIIGLLSTIVGAAIFRQVDKAKITAAKAQLSSLEGTLELYRMDNAKFPSTEQGLIALVEPPTVEPIPHNYLERGYLRDGKIPVDP